MITQMIEKMRFLDELEFCKGCKATLESTQPVFPIGPKRKNGVVIVGRNPGRDEDEVGIPFVGRSGRFLNTWLMECDIPRRECYITNVLKCHTASNRPPEMAELLVCSRVWLHLELKYLEPKMIVVLGADAYWGVFGERLTPFLEQTGKIKDIPEKNCKAVILPHPSAVLTYRPELKEKYNNVVEPVRELYNEITVSQ